MASYGSTRRSTSIDLPTRVAFGLSFLLGGDVAVGPRSAGGMGDTRPEPLVLPGGERRELGDWASGARPQGLALRARIMLACAEAAATSRSGQSSEVMDRLLAGDRTGQATSRAGGVAHHHRRPTEMMGDPQRTRADVPRSPASPGPATASRAKARATPTSRGTAPRPPTAPHAPKRSSAQGSAA
jgi:hypothetical protein